MAVTLYKLACMREDQHLRRLVPVTSVWHLYRFLKRFPRFAFHLEIAREFGRLPSRLDEMIGESSVHFSLYDNRNEPFHNRPSDHSPAQLARYKSSKDVAKRLAALAAAGKLNIQGKNSLAFEYVDYEFRPCRTTRSQHESGSAGYGPGRDMFDLLLVNQADGLPIIGEVKATTDRNPFYALVQGLSHVVAMTTEAQRDRLDRSYPDRFCWPLSGPFVDLYLFLIKYPSGDKEQEFLRLTDKLASELILTDSKTSRLVRRIACVTTDNEPSTDDNDPSTDFSVRFCHGNQG